MERTSGRRSYITEFPVAASLSAFYFAAVPPRDR